MPNDTRPDATIPISVRELLARCMDSREVALLVLDKLETQVQSDLHQIEAASASRLTEELARILHALKGAAAVAGAGPVSDVAATLEAAARSGHLDAADPRIGMLRDELNRCLAYVPKARELLKARP